MPELLAELPGAETDIKEEWGSRRFLVGGKMFGMLGTDNRGRRVLTVKGDPGENEALRAQHPAVVPGYYMNKSHWNSLLLDDPELPEALAEELLAGSYQLVFSALPRRLRTELAGDTPG